MFRIRFHGRGGQGMKTASRILGDAFFREGFEVQDAPRYGAERRGAPVFAYVRAARSPIRERGVINRPALVVVADDTLIGIPAAGVLQGFDVNTTLLIYSDLEEKIWRQRLNLSSPVVILKPPVELTNGTEQHLVGAICAGAAARMSGVINRESFEKSLREELSGIAEELLQKNLERSLNAFDALDKHAGSLKLSDETFNEELPAPDWVELPLELARISAPAIHNESTSEKNRTGLWRTLHPIIDREECKSCWWICSSFCPDSAILVSENGQPAIDYEHCKGCLICAVQCPHHAIVTYSEREAAKGGNE